MALVTDLVEAKAVAALAKPADLRLGEEIVHQGGVAIVDFGPLLVRAKVGGVAASETRRTVVLQSTPAGLSWSCTCTKVADHFCKHCVAAALVIWEKAPNRRR